jgi:hypothetical protein
MRFPQPGTGYQIRVVLDETLETNPRSTDFDREGITKWAGFPSPPGLVAMWPINNNYP